MRVNDISFASMQSAWPEFERQAIRCWDGPFAVAGENEVSRDPSETLLYLPFPYSTASGGTEIFVEMYAWDTYFMNRAMLDYGMHEQVRNHLGNQLFMIERYGFVLNGNRTFYLGRSQPALHADMIWRYVSEHDDRAFAKQAYGLLRREFLEYWCAPHHLSPVGLHRNRDILNNADPGAKAIAQLPTIANLTPEMLAEAETGMDFCPNFEGQAELFVPLITNCVLIRYLEVLAALADSLGTPETAKWRELRADRIRSLRELCWDETRGFFFECNAAEKRRGDVYSLCGFLPLWCGIASRDEASRVVTHLSKFQHLGGLTQTDRQYPSPHSRLENAQWNYPAGWPPFHMLVPEALRRYGYDDEAREVEWAWYRGCWSLWKETGKLYEKYNVVEVSLDLPKERQTEVPPFHGWTTASMLAAGKNLFGSSTRGQA